MTVYDGEIVVLGQRQARITLEAEQFRNDRYKACIDGIVVANCDASEFNDSPLVGKSARIILTLRITFGPSVEDFLKVGDFFIVESDIFAANIMPFNDDNSFLGEENRRNWARKP